MTLTKKRNQEKQKRFAPLANPKFRIGAIVIVLLLSLFFKRMITMYIIFTAMTAVIVYYTRLWHVPIDISPLFFLGLVIVRYYGFQYMILFYMIAYLIPRTLAGHTASWLSYIFVLISWLSFLFVYITPASFPLQILGYITSIIQFLLSALFQSTMKPLLVCLADGIANVLNNLVWFLIFSDLIVFFLV